jgi:transposase
MGRGTPLTPFEKGQIFTLLQQGMSANHIAATIHRSRHVVQNYSKLRDEYGKKKPPGRPSTLSSRAKRRIISSASNRKVSAAEIKKDLNLSQSVTTIGRVLRSEPTLRYEVIQRKPKLKEHHKTARLEWARERMSWTTEWNSVIFTDEKKWNLDGPDGYQCYWHDLRKEPLVLSKQNFGGGSVMLWAGFGYHGKTPLNFVTGSLNSTAYQAVLQQSLLPVARRIGGNRWVFQQDNASCHASVSTREWLSNHGVRVLPWPALSPDLNPIENIWGMLTRRVYSNGRQFQTVAELKRAIQEEWDRLSLAELRGLLGTMPARIFSVINHNGGLTKY